MALGSFAVLGRPFAIWPATLQVMPEGILDAGFGKFFVAVRISNTSGATWPATEIRISPRGRRILSAAKVAVSDGWSTGDGAAVGQTTTTEWIPIPALAVAPAFQTVFFKLDATNATIGLHVLELELRDPNATQTTIKATTTLSIARTVCRGTQRNFTSVSDRGTLTASLGAMTVDQESFRRVLGQARAIAAAVPPGTRSPAETERLRLRLKALLCGEESDVCNVLSDLNVSCALPTPTPPGPAPATGLASVAVFSDQSTTMGDRVRITDGTLWSNHFINTGLDGNISADVISGGDVQIGDRTHIQGNVTAGGVITTTPNGGATVSGAQKQHAPFAPMTIPTKTINIPAGSQVTQINSGQGTLLQPIQLQPGNYASVTINSNAIVALSPGLYQIGTFIVNASVTLIFNQTSTPIDVRVQSNLQLGDRLVVKPGTTPPGVVAQFYSAQTSEARVGTDITPFPLSLTVPAGSIHISARTVITGSLAAKTITFEPDVTVSRVPVDAVVGSGVTSLELLAYPTGLQYTVAYKDGFFGTTGPLALNQAPWKALLANAMIQFDLGLPGAVGAELVSIADQAVVGTVKTSFTNTTTTAPTTTPPSSQAGTVDAATAAVRGNRALGAPPFAFLDAAPGEANTATVGTAGTINTPGTFFSNTEIDALLANPGANGGLSVYKSGAGTGVTRGLISGLLPVVARDDETGTVFFINQLLIVPDPAAPAAAGKVAGFGDSGALWVQTSTNKIVGLGHTVGTTGAVASRIQDVVNALQIQFG
jgi:hypothetical protein